MSDPEKEIEKLKDETDRRELVIREKNFGREIEKIEKSRITPDILSIQQRLLEVVKGVNMIVMSKTNQETQQKLSNTPIGPTAKKTIDALIDNYISIRKDICYTITIGKKEGKFPEKFQDIFPEIKTPIKTYGEMLDIMLMYAEQLLQIRIFLNRYLI